MAKSEMVLGQEVFVLSSGDVVRTMVAALASDGHYTFLNGYDSHCAHWDSYGKALAAARAHLETRRESLRTALRQLAGRERQLQTADYRRGVETAPYKMVDPSYYETGARRTRTRKHVAVPDTYLRPGKRVYVIITPMIEPKGEWVYRPYSHFVLETEVRSVCLSMTGTALYAFDTPLRPDEHFLTRKKAEERLRSYSEPGTAEPIHFVSMKEEKEELAKIDTNPF
jgi:hypothetical protein